MIDHIRIKLDRRFKKGHIQQNGSEYRGHPDTVLPKIVEMPALDPRVHAEDAIRYMANPPMVVSKQLADAIRKMK